MRKKERVSEIARGSEWRTISGIQLKLKLRTGRLGYSSGLERRLLLLLSPPPESIDHGQPLYDVTPVAAHRKLPNYGSRTKAS
ncbi:hypothetical protein M0804_009893 [Polistes exclamans]|nr:hypothetical protein M0804_009893 [Polistes exclamans]